MTRINLSHNHAFQNPILPGFNPDPSIVRVGSDYFCVTSSFEYTPGAPIYHSTDLVRWRLIGHALTRPSQLVIKTVEPGGGVWATTIRHHDGVFYITTCCFDRYRPQLDDRVFPRGFYVRTSNIWDSSSWSDPIYFDLPGFDQDVSISHSHSYSYSSPINCFDISTVRVLYNIQQSRSLSSKQLFWHLLRSSFG